MNMNILQIYIIIIHFIKVCPNYTFYEITAFNPRERYWLYNLYETQKKVFFLNGVTNEAATSMNVVVSDSCSEDFEEKLQKYDIQYSCVAMNVVVECTNKIKFCHESASETFLDWDNILLWVDIKLKEYSVMKKIVIAKTFEHRDIFILKITTAELGHKMAMFMIAGEEGRDWVSSALVLNYIDKILETASSADSLLNHYDMYFIPIFNPDGFVYSKNQDRFWAKNRKDIRPAKICSNDSLAVGVNIDRNWHITKTGLSKDPCNSIFLGFKSLSEEETEGLSYILNRISLKLMAVINLKGFENLITLPYSHDSEISINHNVVMEIMKHVSAVLQEKYQTKYPVETTANFFYNNSGNMADWVKKKLNIPIVFTLYMQQGSFIPKPSSIIPLTNQLETLLNLTLNISSDIYGSLYNKGIRNPSIMVFIMCTILACKKDLLGQL